jgi:hypothetical protein
VEACTQHREFLAAVADGETALVPAATLEHVSTCLDCGREIRAHQVLSSKLRQAADQLGEERVPRRRLIEMAPAQLRVIAAIVAVVLVGAAGGTWFVLSRTDPIQAAANAASQPLQVRSDDPAVVAQWCVHASGRNLPLTELDGMHVVGARMDRAGSTGIVTVTYASLSGERVTVGWLEGQVPSGSGIEDADRSGHRLLIVHAPVGTAVVTSSSADAMWQAAAAIESART